MQTAQENNNRDDIKVRVGEIPSSAQRDIGIGIIRIDTKTMQKINIREGDVVEIEGKRKTGAIALRAYPSDAGVDVIRMDGYMRRNAGTGIGEYVTIKKAEIHEAKSITLAPAEKGVFLQMSGDQLQKILMNRIITKGDIIVPSQAKRSKMPDISEFLNIDIEEIFGGFGFGEMRLIITSTTPKDICKITEVTNITVISKAVEVEEDQISTPAPAVTYEDVGGIKDEVKRVREMIELPIKHPELFERLGIEPPKGVLLHGPPGTGKTLLARAVAAETDVKFYSIAGPEIISKFYGESEQNLRNIFKEAEENAPSIIFIDEIDSIAPKRGDTGEVEKRVVAQLLALMDGLKSRGKVVVIAATNIPNAIDPALRRPGRFDREIELGVPNRDGRKEIFEIHTRNMPLYHWNTNIASHVLKETIASFIEKTKKDIEEDKSNQEKLKSDRNTTQEELSKLNKELEELEKYKDSKNSTTHIIETILNKIQFKISEKRKIEEKIKDTENNIDKLSKEIEKLKENIDTFIKIRKQIEKYPKILTEISKELEDIEHISKIRGKDDARAAFSKKAIKEKDKEFQKIFEELKDIGLISKEMHSEIVNRSVLKMISEYADKTHGYVGADINALCKESAMAVLRKIIPKINLEKEIPKDILASLRVTDKDFNEAQLLVEPSAMREVLVDIPMVKWNDVGGLTEAKQYLKEMVEWPLKHPESFRRLGIKPPKGILLHGLPGTGKTLLAKAIANESQANFLTIKGSSIFNKYVGESEKAIREIFKRAKQVAPSIIFIDEIEAIASHRGKEDGSGVTDRVVNQLLVEMDGLEGLDGVVIISATNRIDLIDTALLRAGRLDRHVYVPVPDKDTRKKVFEIHTKNMPLAKDISIDKLVGMTENFVGADIEAICREAAIAALRESNLKAKEVSRKDFESAIKKHKPAVSKEDIDRYKSIVLKSHIKQENTMDEDMSYYG